MKQSELSALLTIVASWLTALVSLGVLGGTGLLGEHLLVGGLALGLWLGCPRMQPGQQAALVPLYILAIVGLLVLNLFRYVADYPAVLQAVVPQWVRGQVPLTDTTWFLLYVCAPVSTLLAGGYWLSRFTEVGQFFAGWAFLYGIVEALLQITLELGGGHSYPHQYFGGILAAMAVFYGGVRGALLLLAPRDVALGQPPALPTSERIINAWSVLFVALVVLYATTLYAQAGFLPVGVVVGSMMGGLLGWRRTTARFPGNPQQLVPLYLLLLALFYAHVGEEALTGFNRQIAALSGVPWHDREFTTFIAFIGPVVWVYAAYSLWRQQAFGNFVLWFLVVGMILGEPTHLVVFPVVRMVREGIGYAYFSGMYTALFPMIPAILALVVILQQHRARQRVPHHES